MERVAHGDAATFDRLYSRYRGLVYGIALRRVRDREAAEDVVTDAMTRVYRAASTFHEGSRLSTWITRIAINASIDAVRKRARERTLNIEEAEGLLDQLAGTGDYWADSLENDAELHQEELSKAIHDSLGRMSEPQRELLLMYYKDHLLCSQIAAARHIAVGTVKSQLHRARNTLREGLPSTPGLTPRA
jgi:RNA polymerase sigma-70 factor, ECF subfamily